MSLADNKRVDNALENGQVVGLLHELSLAAGASIPITDACQRIMAIAGRHFGWTIGRVLLLDDNQIEGETTLTWVHPDEFKPTLHRLGVGNSVVIDDVLVEQEPIVISNVLTDSAAFSFFSGSLNWVRGYIACPIRIDGQVQAVIEFFSTRPLPPNPTLNGILAHSVMLLSLVIERSWAKTLLREGERRFRGIFDQSYQFIGLLQPDGTLVEINETALELGALSSDQVVGQKFWDTYWWQATPESAADLKYAVRRAAAGEIVRYEASIQGVGGQIAYTDFSIKPIRNRKHDIVLLIAEGRNITDLRQALEHLSLTEQRLEEAQRIAHIGHWEYNVSEDRAYFSDRILEIFGLDPVTTQVSPENLFRRVHPDDINGLQRTLNRSYRSGSPFELHFRLVRPDGTTRMVYMAGGVMANEAGEITRIMGIIQDVSGRRQLEESLAHSVERLSGLNAMGQAVASSLDLSDIYQRVLATGRSLLDADAMILFSHEGNELFISAVDQVDGLDLLGRRIPDHTGIAGEVWTSGQSGWFYGEECRTHRSSQLATTSGFNPGCIIAVPVRWQDQVLGVLEAADVDEDAFDAEDVSLLEAVANWTAIAIVNASQHHSLERRLMESEAIASVSRALSETLEPQAILELIVNTAHDIVPRSDWGVIHILRGRPEKLDPAAVAGTDADLSDYIIGPEEGIAGLALKESKVINVGETRLDPRSSSYAQTIGLRSLLVAPIVTRNRRLGTISLHCMLPNAFTPEDERLLTILAAQAGLAIENAHLFDSQRRARLVAELQRERMRVLADRVVSAQEEERLRISRELHDEAGQALTSLKISLDLIRSGLPPGLEILRDRLTDLSALTGETMESLRTLAHDLRPPGLDAFGLHVALEGLCHDFATRTGLNVTYEGIELDALPTTLALSMYRLAQEGLTNIAKHADARHVHVALSQTEGSVFLSIADDGKGFAFDPESRPGSGIGLVSMQERADLIGGSLEIESSPGKGTRLIARIPVDANRIESELPSGGMGY